jgi:hypothetical protein
LGLSFELQILTICGPEFVSIGVDSWSSARWFFVPARAQILILRSTVFLAPKNSIEDFGLAETSLKNSNHDYQYLPLLVSFIVRTVTGFVRFNAEAFRRQQRNGKSRSQR